MPIQPTPVTAALAGALSAIAWPWLWPLVNDPSSSSTTWLVAGMLLFVALPAHALVVGFRRQAVASGPGIDKALLVRIGAWLLSAAVCSALVSLYRPAG